MKTTPQVYLLECREKGAFKIGYTSKLVNERFSEISRPTGNPWKEPINVEYVHGILCESIEVARFLEDTFHEALAEYRVFSRRSAEWFTHVPHWISMCFSERSKTDELHSWKEISSLIRSYIAKHFEVRSSIQFDAVAWSASVLEYEGPEAILRYIYERFGLLARIDIGEKIRAFENLAQSTSTIG